MDLNNNLNKILIIDFGSQFTQLIARRIRELGVFSEIISHTKLSSKINKTDVKGIILSGGPRGFAVVRCQPRSSVLKFGALALNYDIR